MTPNCGDNALSNGPKCEVNHTDWNHSPWPGTIVTICMSYFMTGGPGKEQGTNTPLLTGRVQERSKGDITCPTTSQNPSHCRPPWLSNVRTTRKDSEPEDKDNPETNPITIKPTASHVAEQFSWVPLPYCSLPGHPFPIKSPALATHVSPLTIHFQVLEQNPLSGPGRGSPSCNTSSLKISNTGSIKNCIPQPSWGK